MMEATEEKILSIDTEPGYIVIGIGNINLKLPATGTLEDMHDTAKLFIEELFSVNGVKEVLDKYGVIIEEKVIN